MGKTKRKRNNWGGPSGGETVYAVVFWWLVRGLTALP